MSNSKYLFVYGTLLRDHAPAEISNVVGRLRRVGAAKMKGKLYDLGEYPAAVAAPGSNAKVFGQVFEVPGDPEVLKALDQYEGYDPASPKSSLFLRQRRFVTLSGGRRVLSWVYLFNGLPKSGHLLQHGSYSRFKSQGSQRKRGRRATSRRHLPSKERGAGSNRSGRD